MRSLRNERVGPLQPNFSMHILHTVLNTFLKVLIMRICLIIFALTQNFLFIYHLYTPILKTFLI